MYNENLKHEGDVNDTSIFSKSIKEKINIGSGGRKPDPEKIKNSEARKEL